MERDRIIEEFISTCGLDMFGIIDLINKHGFQLVRSTDHKSYPRMASFYQNGIKNKIMVIPAYLPYDRAIWLLKYLMVTYLMKQDEDIYITIDESFNYNQDIKDLIDEINERLNNGHKRNK